VTLDQLCKALLIYEQIVQWITIQISLSKTQLLNFLRP
jgi:hypothetical protein